MAALKTFGPPVRPLPNIAMLALFWEMEMARTNLGSMSVDALLTLRDDIEKVLSSKANELKNKLARLGSEIGAKNEGAWKLAERPEGSDQIP